MHPNPVFRQAPEARNREFARARGFAMLSVARGDTPLLAHVPFLLNDDGTEAELHLVRSNPIAHSGPEPMPAIIAVTGPDSYISPDWYGVADQVPTWNYVAVHLTGTLRRADPDELGPMLERLSAHFEAHLTPKPVWTMDKMSDGVAERMMRAILPFRMAVTGITGTWKLNQNKADAVRLAAAREVETNGVGTELAQLAAMMRSDP